MFAYGKQKDGVAVTILTHTSKVPGYNLVFSQTLFLQARTMPTFRHVRLNLLHSHVEELHSRDRPEMITVK